MRPFERILFPTDFSDESKAALPYAAQLAGTFRAELHVLYVDVLHGHVSDAALRFPKLDEYVEALGKYTGQLFDGLLATGLGDDLEVRRAVRRAVSAAPEIVQYATDQGVDLIVMATHGRRGLRKLALGSVAQEVVRHAGCPVLTVRGSQAPQGFDRGTILVPVDLSPRSRLAVEQAARFARSTGARVELLHVVAPTPVIAYSAYPELPPMPVVEVREESERRLAELRDEAGLDPSSCDLTVIEGPVVLTILDRAREVEPDLLIQASAGLSGPTRWLLGSVAENIVSHVACPVLTVREGDVGTGTEPGSTERDSRS
ncbi:MAG TPA: universal stress protein [Thermoanaerobaculia bacterium]|nr:universal stress protein [Thermoanaerobaculia bacterium]